MSAQLDLDQLENTLGVTAREVRYANRLDARIGGRTIRAIQEETVETADQFLHKEAPALLAECRRLQLENARLRALAVLVINADLDNSPRVPAPVMRDTIWRLAKCAREVLTASDETARAALAGQEEA